MGTWRGTNGYDPVFPRGNDHARLTLDLALGELVSENALRAEAGISCADDTRSVPADLASSDTRALTTLDLVVALVNKLAAPVVLSADRKDMVRALSM